MKGIQLSGAVFAEGIALALKFGCGSFSVDSVGCGPMAAALGMISLCCGIENIGPDRVFIGSC